MPPCRALLYAIKEVFLTTPFSVAQRTYLFSSKVLTERMLAIFSLGFNANRLAMDFPLAVRPASGILYTFSHCTFPRLVKISRVSRLEATNNW